jgi:hypothetical protein
MMMAEIAIKTQRIHEFRVIEGQVDRVLCQGLEVRVRGPGDGKKGEFEQADDDRYPFECP